MRHNWIVNIVVYGLAENFRNMWDTGYLLVSIVE